MTLAKLALVPAEQSGYQYFASFHCSLACRPKGVTYILPSSVISWIFDYLTSRLQYVRLNGLLSSAISTNTGAPQGTVLAPSLFALYTALCRSTDESCPVVKFADDTELVGKISDDEDAIYHKQIENFVNWCDKNDLYLNVSKTKEMYIDFRKNQRCPKPVYIKGEAVERVDTYKYT